jgi:hypothetical protein
MHRRWGDRLAGRAATIVSLVSLACLGLSAAVCGGDRQTTRHEDHGDVYVQGQPEEMSPEALEAGRRDASWRQVVQLDTLTLRDSAGSPERWEQITAETVNGSPMHVPLYGDVAGPSVLRLQVLLDRAMFSPAS